MSAGRFIDYYGLLRNHALEQADAVRAYTQAPLMGVTTWVRLPRDQWPQAWRGFRDPVCPLALALYGHPDAGTCWELWCDEALRLEGFVAILGWDGRYRHSGLRLLLSVYVDDFRLSGPAENLDKGWQRIQKRIGLEPPTKIERYLGCVQREFTARLDQSKAPGQGVPGGPDPSGATALANVRGMEYDLSSFIRSCVEA